MRYHVFTRTGAILTLISMMTAVITADHKVHEDEGTCSAPPVNRDDMVPRERLLKTTETKERMEINLKKKDDSLKELRSQFSNYKSTVSKLEDEIKLLRGQVTEAQEKVKNVQQEFEEEAGTETETKVSKLGDDLKHCLKKLEDFEKRSDAWDKEFNDHYLHMHKIHKVEYKCRNDLIHCEKEKGKQEERSNDLESKTGSKELQEAQSQLNEKNREVEKLEEALLQLEEIQKNLSDCEKSKLKKMKKKMSEKESLAFEKYGFVSDDIKGKVIPWEANAVPDIFDRDVAEGKQLLDEMRSDYYELFELSRQSSELFVTCIGQRQDFKIMKYFLGKYLAKQRMVNAALRDELEEALLKKDLQANLSDYVEKDQFDIMERDRGTCLSDIKDLRKKSAADSRDLKYTREDVERARNDAEKHKESAENCARQIEGLEAFRKEKSTVITGMEDTEEKQKKTVEDTEKDLETAIASAERYRRYFTVTWLTVTTFVTSKVYVFIRDMLTQSTSDAKDTKKTEDTEKKSKQNKIKTK